MGIHRHCSVCGEYSKGGNAWCDCGRKNDEFILKFLRGSKVIDSRKGRYMTHYCFLIEKNRQHFLLYIKYDHGDFDGTLLISRFGIKHVNFHTLPPETENIDDDVTEWLPGKEDIHHIYYIDDMLGTTVNEPIPIEIANIIGIKEEVDKEINCNEMTVLLDDE